MFGLLTVLAAVAALIVGALASVFISRMEDLEATPMNEQIGGARTVLGKLRKHEPMSTDEVNLARKIIAERTSPMAYCIPAAIFALGCFYIFGSFEQLHGRSPSFRTYIGFFPMLGSVNLTIQLRRIARLKQHLRTASGSP